MQDKNYEKAIFAAGCFWGVEEAFKMVKGVKYTQTGYTGGIIENPTYRQVCSDTTEHSEAVEVLFDPNEVSYEKLLKVFFAIHNPTQVNRQGNDIGSQYRSAVFYTTDQQKQAAQSAKDELEKSAQYDKQIATEIQPAVRFYSAEDYHQDYLDKNPNGYCHINFAKVRQILDKDELVK